uniref:Major facilitator superfamily (MFS) profile domain-containing protein n=2 Tax=Aegilops tauschii subsp. strangulata TaxID=200361 RepID=A0A453IDF3_AEGTS
MSLLELSEDEETTTCSSCARPRREANLILHQAIGGEYMSVTDAGYLSVLFDVGEIIGGILAGFMSDQLDARATTACIWQFHLFMPFVHMAVLQKCIY